MALWGLVALFGAFPSAEVLPPRTRADPRGLRPVPPGSSESAGSNEPMQIKSAMILS